MHNVENKEISYYLDLGENPAPLFLRRIALGLALAMIPLGIYAIIDGLIEGRSFWRTITSILNFFGVIGFGWHLHHERFTPAGEAFVRITSDMIEFRNMGQKETTRISLNQIINSDRQWQKIGLKVDSKPWFYVAAPSRAKAKLIFEHLQKAIQAKSPTGTNVN
jgi:hypothetical protein